MRWAILREIAVCVWWLGPMDERMGYRGSVGAFAVTVVALIALSPFVPAGDWKPLVFGLAGAACLVLIGVGLKRHGVAGSWAWRMFTLAVAFNLIGDLVSFGSASNLFGSRWSDAFYLAAFPLFAWGLFGFMRVRRVSGEGSLPQLADAGIVFLAGLAVLWLVTIDPGFDKSGLPLAQRVLSVLYPLLDWALLALLLRLLFSAGRWPASYRLLVAAFVLMLGGDVVSRSLVVRGTVVTRTWIDVVSL